MHMHTYIHTYIHALTQNISGSKLHFYTLDTASTAQCQYTHTHTYIHRVIRGASCTFLHLVRLLQYNANTHIHTHTYIYREYFGEQAALFCTWNGFYNTMPAHTYTYIRTYTESISGSKSHFSTLGTASTTQCSGFPRCVVSCYLYPRSTL